MQEILRVTTISLRSVPRRLGSSLVVCVGVGCVVAVLISVLAMATGLKGALAKSGHSDRAIVLRDGALAESMSSLTRQATLVIETSPAVARAQDGRTAVSPEVVVTVNLPRVGDQPGPIVVRGLTDRGLSVHSEIELVEGRLFTPGRHEVVVGQMARREFRQLDVGASASFHRADWKVVGVFASNGDSRESELLTDAATLMSAAQRTVFNAVTVKLVSPEAIEDLQAALDANPTLKVRVQRETEYYENQSVGISRLLYFVAYVVSAIMALGAVFGALNTMYTAISARSVEIATLRAIGFGAMPIVFSVLIEALALSLVGAIAGAAVAWVLFNGHTYSVGGAFRQVAVELDVGTALFVVGVAWACGIGLLGGLLPAIRAARQPVSLGLRVAG